jgi:hypothetical protein
MSSLTATEVRVLSRLLERARALPPAEREAWLAALPEPQQLLVPRLRERLEQLAHTETEAAPPPPPPPPRPAPRAEVRVGPYRLLAPLGADEHAPVWKAERAEGGARKTVALRLPPAPEPGAAAMARPGERQVVLLPEHPDILRLIDAGIDAEGRFYRVLPFVEGLDLVEHVQRRGLGAHQRAQLMLQACMLIAHAHDEEVAYGELQLSSLRMDDEGRLRLLDWGQGRSLLPLTRLADVQALGRVMQAVLSGAAPGAVAPARRAPEPGPDLQRVLQRALHAPGVPGYTSVAELQAELQMVCDFRPVPGAAGGSVHLARLFLRRHRARLGAAALGLALLAALAHWGWNSYQRSQGQAQRADQVQAFLESALRLPEAPQGVTPEASASAAASVAAAASDPAVQAPLLQRALEQARTGFDGEPVLRGQVITALAVRFRAIGQADQALTVLREAHTLLKGTASAGDPALHGAAAELAQQLLDNAAPDAANQASALAHKVLEGCTSGGLACTRAREVAQQVLKATAPR